MVRSTQPDDEWGQLRADLNGLGLAVDGVDQLGGPRAPEYHIALPLLLSWLGTCKNAYVKDAVIRAIIRLRARSTVPSLLDEFRREDVEYLGWRGVDDPNEYVRSSLGEALRQLASPKHLDELIELSTQTEYGLARAPLTSALSVLKKSPHVAEVLTHLLHDEIPAVRAMAARSMGRLGLLADEEVLEAASDDENEWVRKEVASARRKLAGGRE